MSKSAVTSLFPRPGVLCVAVSLFATQAANAAFITEYFDYGATAGTDLGGKGTAGGGWAGAWTASGGGYNSTQDYGTANLNYTATGYANTDNGGSTGSATGTGTTVNSVGQQRLLSTGLTGTIWVSFLASSSNVNSGGNGHALVGFNDNNVNSTDNVLGLLRNTSIVRWNSATVGSSLLTPTANTTYLFLAKIETNVSGTDDRITVWVNPNLTSLSAGTVAPLKDIGASLTGISVFNNSFGTIDAIRISNNANGFSEVTAVPEPAMLSALALAGAVAMRRRRVS